ncbi:MAG: endonuclease III [Clostridiales bacterium]|nr:endonuclease III [Clostridiales bacterium]
MKKPREIEQIIAILKNLYPDAACSLDYGKAYELLFSVRLAAQCTDARVNLVTPALFAKYPTLASFAEANVDEVGEYVHSCGFWRSKARDIVASAQMLLSRFDGRVPDNMDDLLTLPGVGRKTANLILGDVYHQASYVCDTHCIRITGRLGITDGSKDPLSVEKQLRTAVSPEESSNFCHRMVLHGRHLCMARNPQCESCPLAPLCNYAKEKK